MKQLFNYLKRYKFDMIGSLLLVFISSASALIIPKMIELVINDGINAKGGPDQALMEKFGIIMMVIAAIGLIAGVTNAFFTARLSQNVGADMRKDGFKRIQDYSYQDIEKFKTANLVVRLTNDINQIQSVIMLMFSTLLRTPVLLIGSFVLAMTTMPQLWYIIIILLVLVSLVLFYVAKKMMPEFSKFQIQLDRINGTIKENFEGARVVKSFVTEADEEEKFEVDNQKLADLNLKIGRTFAIVMPAMMLIVNVITALVIFLTAKIAISDVGAIGAMVSYINYLSQIMMSLIIGGMVMLQFSRAIISLTRFNEIMTTNPTIKYPETGIDNIVGDIEFKNVTFTYPDATYPSLTNISFKITHGQKIGIIGATGSGKSTLVHLLLRLFDISNGELLIDGINIKKIPKQVLRDDISIVLQKPILFSGTIQENLINGSEVNKEEMKEAAKAAQAAEFIENMGSTYKSNVLQRGSNFSGGQKQRLSIARGLIGRPPILVLDDSTSALDSRSEKLVKEALYTKYDDQTILIIAQKIASIIDADRIIVLDEGQLSGFDTHENLIQNNKAYQEIYNTQKGRDKDGKSV